MDDVLLRFHIYLINVITTISKRGKNTVSEGENYLWIIILN